MNQAIGVKPVNHHSLLEWAAEKRADLVVSHAVDGGWVNLRSRFIRFDQDQNVIEITYPQAGEHQAPPEIVVGQNLGISFRRGHKKCLFVSGVAMRREEVDSSGLRFHTLVLRVPEEIRSLQRRAFQRVMIPPNDFIAVKLWEGGVPEQDSVAWPLCSGRVANISVGGVLVDIRTDQNPRLRVSDIVGVEITARPGAQPISIDGQYRHCVQEGEGRLGLGFQFLALEHSIPGRSTIMEVAEFVRSLRRTRRH
ncbi:MAG: PilZ domain-containing protein [Phycisphaerae bacterium]